MGCYEPNSQSSLALPKELLGGVERVVSGVRRPVEKKRRFCECILHNKFSGLVYVHLSEV